MCNNKKIELLEQEIKDLKADIAALQYNVYGSKKSYGIIGLTDKIEFLLQHLGLAIVRNDDQQPPPMFKVVSLNKDPEQK